METDNERNAALETETRMNHHSEPYSFRILDRYASELTELAGLIRTLGKKFILFAAENANGTPVAWIFRTLETEHSMLQVEIALRDERISVSFFNAGNMRSYPLKEPTHCPLPADDDVPF